MASHWYHKAITAMLQRDATLTIDLDTDTIKCGLSTAVHVPDPDDGFLDIAGTADFTANEATGTNYTGAFGGSGRKALVTKTCASDTATNRTKFDADDLTWTAYNPTTATAHATILKEITNDTLSPTIINLDFSAVDPNGNDFILQFHADGIGYIAV